MLRELSKPKGGKRDAVRMPMET